MMLPFPLPMQALRRLAACVLAAGALAACTPAPMGPSILATSATSRLIAASARGANHVRILHVSDGSVVLMRTVVMPPGERVVSVTWSNDGRDAVIATSNGVLALDTRTWRLDARARVAAVARDESGAGGRS